jgi:hypothetical protein
MSLYKEVPYTRGKKGFVNTPQFPGMQTGLNIDQVRHLIDKQKSTRGFAQQIATGTSVFNLELSGTARIWLGFALLPLVTDAGAISLAAMPEQFNLQINNQVICDQTHPAFYTQFLNDWEYYFIPRPLSGTDDITVTWQNAGASQDWVMIVYYI